jgi:GAF domain-containing protein
MSESRGGEPQEMDPRETPGGENETRGESMDPMLAFAELGRLRLGDNDLRQVLAHIADLAKATIPGATEVSVTLVADRGAGTAAYTGEMALAIDEMQYDVGSGPCLDASADPTSVRVVRDAVHETRWEGFAEAAARVGVGSSMSVGVPVVQQLTGALNIYSAGVDAFDSDAIALAETFASYAAVALANAHLYETTSALASQMSSAMMSRAVIEQAKGILIAQQGVDGDEAFQMLSRASQTSNRKLRDIAQAIVDGAQRGREAGS